MSCKEAAVERSARGVCVRVRRETACEWKAGRERERGGGKRVGDSASRRRRGKGGRAGERICWPASSNSWARRTGESADFHTQHQQKIFCIRTLLSAYTNLHSTLTVGCGCTFYEIKDALYRAKLLHDCTVKITLIWLWYQHCYNTNKQTKSLSIFSMAADITHVEVCALFGFLCFFSILSACAWLAANCILINKISNKPQRRAEPSRGIWNEFTALVFVHTIGDSLFLCVCICVFGDTQLAWPGAPLKSLTGVGLRREPICPYVCEQSDRRRMREPGGGVREGGRWGLVLL